MKHFVPSKADRIRELNDDFRRTFQGGRVLLTSSIAQLPDDQKGKIIDAINASSPK
jgi:hypothetical protein